jgi:transcription initiation factor TFIIB
MTDAVKRITIRVKIKKINCTENIKSMNEPEVIHLAEQKTSNKTQKKKKVMTYANKSKLWDVFDSDKKTLHQESSDTNIECLYSSNCEKETCSVCDSHLIIMDDGFPTCTNINCAIIYKDVLDYSPEWRFYGAEDKNANDPTRCGNPINPLLVESSFGCKVLCNNKSSYEMKKIRKWTEWQSMPHKEKSLYDEFQFITHMAQNSGIPKIFIDDAMVLHKDISEQKMFRGMNRDGIKAASIYISCRLNGCPRTAHEIAEIFKLDKTSATNGCSMAVNILHNIERNVDPSKKADLCVTLPSLFIDRYCSRMNFNKEMTMLAKFVTNKIEKNNIVTDNIPHAIAAGVIYFVSQVYALNINKVDIKNISGVSEVTINKCYKKLDNIKETLIPKCILDKLAI